MITIIIILLSAFGIFMAYYGYYRILDSPFKLPNKTKLDFEPQRNLALPYYASIIFCIIGVILLFSINLNKSNKIKELALKLSQKQTVNNELKVDSKNSNNNVYFDLQSFQYEFKQLNSKMDKALYRVNTSKTETIIKTFNQDIALVNQISQINNRIDSLKNEIKSLNKLVKNFISKEDSLLKNLNQFDLEPSKFRIDFHIYKMRKRKNNSIFSTKFLIVRFRVIYPLNFYDTKNFFLKIMKPDELGLNSKTEPMFIASEDMKNLSHLSILDDGSSSFECLIDVGNKKFTKRFLKNNNCEIILEYKGKLIGKKRILNLLNYIELVDSE
jgi:hypothetical protein